MNSSKISNEMNTIQIYSRDNNIKKKLNNTNNLSFYTYNSKFNNYILDNPNYRKTISYLRQPKIKDLIKETDLNENRKISFDKNYLVNLIKIKSKKDKNILPCIKTLNAFSSYQKKKLYIFSIDFNNKNNNDKFQRTYNNSYRNNNKEKIRELYNKIYNFNDKMKCININKLIKKNNQSEGKESEDDYEKESFNLKIKPKIITGENQNLINSQKKFMRYHGSNKVKNLWNHNYISYDFIKKDKYPNENNITIRRHFLKKKLKKLNKNLIRAKDDCKESKDHIIYMFDNFNENIQKYIDDVFKSEDL